jgi:hypothetical protein
MSFNVKTEQGLERIHSVRVKPSTAGKTITANGTYHAISEGVDGYSAVTVSVATETPEDLELVGVMNSSWWWDDNDKNLRRPEDINQHAYGRAALKSGMPIEVPAGCVASVTWDKSGLQISGEAVHRDGSRDESISIIWQAQPYVCDNRNGAESIFIVFTARKSDNTDFSASELPTKLIVTYSR